MKQFSLQIHKECNTSMYINENIRLQTLSFLLLETFPEERNISNPFKFICTDQAFNGAGLAPLFANPRVCPDTFFFMCSAMPGSREK